ncbi:cation transporter, putative [Trypanosoma brucei gambiense DAL972]|uniref:Cation transporter, putative n=3 Tax=Trypanosoma brucei TaxID=5691 RepID=Q384C8_TRYB2|nr:cation transporter, putative [Trypanosoma brucei gambiense DAL972]XP_828965.1 cation transporter, putative [Trypanosoma brucei brucei TREU927]RHW67447.1 cation transporter [Trypanosoma brucei equiperdum]EAN79853.1 cation transporter, putative [Trypanosoma brucei brucei TREU927]RHW68340.1 cation transporter [Trypanosoma brucei equiperdum]CBH17887.1 cation transporter, putative [Trypanosoma brucei gambiense DAL972]|eukprot:XP_011780151.1 cation transporter, putative [Trypanosoma brucei gambiense DAL972]
MANVNNETTECGALLSNITSLQTTLTSMGCQVPALHHHTHDHGHHHHHHHHDDHTHGADDHEGHGHSHGGCESGHGTYSIGLHVVAIFVVLIASFLGTLIPIIGKYVPALRLPPFVFVLGKCIAAGVLLSVSTIHMINEAVAQLQEDCVPESFRESYEAYAFLFAVAGALLLHMVDVIVDARVTNKSDSSTNKPEGQPDAEEAQAAPAALDAYDGHHCHYAVGMPQSRTRRLVSAMFMEFAVTVHSVFIGLAVGIARDAETKTLLVALAFHQMLEGLALGARLVDAELSLKLEMLFALLFSVSAPLGTAIAVGTIAIWNVSMVGTAFVITQAVASAVCGGMLLYLAFCLMLSDFPSDMQKHAGKDKVRRFFRCFGMFAALWLGAALMAVLGKWV